MHPYALKITTVYHSLTTTSFPKAKFYPKHKCPPIPCDVNHRCDSVTLTSSHSEIKPYLSFRGRNFDTT